jgi:6-phosphogluconolactonase
MDRPTGNVSEQAVMDIRTPDIISEMTMELLAERLAAHVAAEIASVIADRGHCVLAVAGGKTPVLFFRALARQPVEWDDVTVTLSDERFVPPTHADSNEAMVRRELLAGAAAKVRFVGLYHMAETPEAALAMVNLPSPIDILIVGMGDDMHTLSWFPGAEGLMQALTNSHSQRLAVVRPGILTPRITLTAGAVGEARFIHLLIAGGKKKAALDQALATPSVEAAPVRRLFAYRNPKVDVYWAQEA